MKTNQLYEEEIEIDLWAVFRALKKNLLLILLAAGAGLVLFYLGTRLFITPTYDSTTKIYVLNQQDNTNQSITYSDLQSSTQLTKDYMELVKTRPVLEDVISALGLEDTTYDELKEEIRTATATDGRIIAITVTDKDPRQAKAIADAVRDAVSSQIMKVMDVRAVNVVEPANLPEKKARPGNMKNALIGGILGFLIALGCVVMETVLDDRVKTEEDVEKYLSLSVLGTLPLEEGLGKKKGRKRIKKASKKDAKKNTKKRKDGKVW